MVDAYMFIWKIEQIQEAPDANFDLGIISTLYLIMYLNII